MDSHYLYELTPAQVADRLNVMEQARAEWAAVKEARKAGLPDPPAPTLTRLRAERALLAAPVIRSRVNPVVDTARREAARKAVATRERNAEAARERADEATATLSD